MKIRLMSPALRARFGEIVDSDNHPNAEHWIRCGVAIKVAPKRKRNTASTNAKKAETRSDE